MKNSTENIGHYVNGIDISKIDKHPNILIAASFWEKYRYHAAKVCYRFMREIDDYVDENKSKGKTVTCMEKQVLSEKVKSWIKCLDKNANNDPFIQELIQTIETYKIPLQYFHNFAIAMQYDIDHNGFPTFQSFIDYAEGASVAPASIFLHLCCLQKENGSYSVLPINIQDAARSCALFSYLVHIIRDFQKDQSDGLNYFALDVLKENNLTPNDLKAIAGSGDIPDDFRNVIRFYKGKAEEYRKQTVKQIELLQNYLEPRYLMSLNIIYRLYFAIYNRINIDNGSFTTQELTLSNEEVYNVVLKE